MGIHDSNLVKLFVTGQNQIAPRLHYIYKKKFGYEKYSNIKSYIDNRYSDSESYQETIKRMQYGIETRPVCKYCGKPVKYIGKQDKVFGTYCSNSCRGKDVSKDIWVNGQKKYNLEHYGVEYNFQREDVKQKREATIIEKYGSTNLYSVPSIKEKVQSTLNVKYGVSNFSDFVKLPEIQQKKNATCKERYGNEQPLKREDYRLAQSNKLKSYAVRLKANETLKHNKSHGTSKPEEYCYEFLCRIYGNDNVLRQYMTEVYPFKCDFYIKTLDIYIEYNGSQFHHGHAFDCNNKDDIEELNRLKKSAEESYRHKEGKKSQYDAIIYTWTDLDVRKRNTAKQNNLKYIEFWNLDDVRKWIESR